ncbi:MAG TPA: VanZ family protein, partial [Planctomycetota bacterium]|nr:VanZ family protein [Planctomycetota bacterium]
RDPVRTLNRLVVAAIVVYVAASLWPFDFELPARIENGARPAPEGGLRFDSPGLAESAGSPDWVADAVRAQRLELELSLRSRAFPSSEFLPLVTLSRNRHFRNLAIGQDGRDLVLHLRAPETRPRGRNYRLASVFPAQEWTEVVLLVEPGRVLLTIDGTVCLDRKLPADPLSAWDPSYRLALGNELAGNRPWIGELRHARVRAGEVELDLAAPGVLERPERYWFIRTTPQLVPLLDSSPEDMLVNSLLYLPLGLLLGARRRAAGSRARPRPWACVLLVSATIELAQLFVSVRCASTGDLVLNVAGGAAGAGLGSLLMLGWMTRRLRAGIAPR